MKKTTTQYYSDGRKYKSYSYFDEDENIIKRDSKLEEKNYSYDSNKNITEIKSVSKVDDKINYLKQKNIYDTEKRLIKQTTIDDLNEGIVITTTKDFNYTGNSKIIVTNTVRDYNNISPEEKLNFVEWFIFDDKDKEIEYYKFGNHYKLDFSIDTIDKSLLSELIISVNHSDKYIRITEYKQDQELTYSYEKRSTKTRPIVNIHLTFGTKDESITYYYQPNPIIHDFPIDDKNLIDNFKEIIYDKYEKNQFKKSYYTNYFWNEFDLIEKSVWKLSPGNMIIKIIDEYEYS